MLELCLKKLQKYHINSTLKSASSNVLKFILWHKLVLTNCETFTLDSRDDLRCYCHNLLNEPHPNCIKGDTSVGRLLWKRKLILIFNQDVSLSV